MWKIQWYILDCIGRGGEINAPNSPLIHLCPSENALNCLVFLTIYFVGTEFPLMFFHIHW